MTAFADPPPVADGPPRVLSYAAFLATKARDCGERAALTCGRVSRTWSQLERRTNRLARALLRSGARQGSLVAIMLPNGVPLIESCLAVSKIGATPQLLSYRLAERERATLLNLVKPSLIIAEDAALARGWPLFRMSPSAGRNYSDSPLPEVAPAAMVATATGGSTGMPKIVINADPAVVGDSTYAAISASAKAFEFHKDMTIVVPGPLYHNGPYSMAMAALMSGGHLVIMPRFDPVKTLREVERHGATHLFLVPTMMSRIWKLGEIERQRYDLSSLHAVWRGAAICPEWLAQAWIDWLGPQRIWDIYGASDGTAACRIRGDEWLSRRGSVGRVCLGEIEIRDSDGHLLPPGSVGAIYMRRPEHTMQRRYIGVSQIDTSRGWRTVGDLGHMDEDGFLYVADRRSDLIISGGVNIYPAEIEAAIERHHAVEAAVVVGLHDDDMGKIIHAVVQRRELVTEDELRNFLVNHLSKNKIPREFTFSSKQLRDDAGKVRRQLILSDIATR